MIFVLGAGWLALHTVVTEHTGVVALAACVLLHPRVGARRALQPTPEDVAR